MIINGIYWDILFVPANSPKLKRSDGSITIGMTDGLRRVVYLNNGLKGRLLDKVMAHELVHCFMFSYDINIDIEQEEFIADWVATYGRELIYLLDDLAQNLIAK